MNKEKQSKLIAFCGYARAGKDVIAQHLLDDPEYVRMNFGDFIKEFYNPFLRGEMSLNDLEVAISERLFSEKSEEDLKQFLAKYAEPYDAGEHTIDAFTEQDDLKKIIRPILEHGGELIYGWVMDEYQRKLDEYVAQGRSVVNTRMCQLPEAEAWASKGGLVVYIDRQNHQPASQWDADIVSGLADNNHIGLHVINDGVDADDWNNKAKHIAEMIEEGYEYIRDSFHDYKTKMVMVYEPTVSHHS